jgi:ribulose-bisphosphate carboxylase large chain
VTIPKSLLKSFPGPKYGIEGVRKFMKVRGRPFVGTIVKPKLGLNPKDHSECAYEAWLGGCDFVKDDENLSSQDFNKFEKRLSLTLAAADKAESITGEKKAYLCNVTAETKTMLKRAQMIQDQGGKYMMIDILTAGFAGLQTLRQENFKLAIHGHRAMHAALTRNPKHGMSMMTLADFSRMCGIDSLHIGTGIGKLEGKIDEIYEIEEEIEGHNVKATKMRLAQNWESMKSTLAVSSGGLHPGHIPFLIKHLGKDLSIQMGGGLHGNRLGTLGGARAARQAVDAVMKGFTLKEYAKTHPELKSTLEQWGEPKTR